MTTTVETPVQAWRLFRARVARTQRLSPSFVRITFTGEQLAELGDDGYDQRIKLLLPAPDGSLDLQDSDGLGWYAELRQREDERRNPLRTYTSRFVRAHDREVDVDFVLHGDTGPASRWAGRVEVGDEVLLCGPNALHGGPYGGTGFAPANGTSRFLVVADETAVPAALAILERLPREATGAALLEVPDAGDVLEHDAPAGVDVTWLPREHHGAHGSALEPAVVALLEVWLGEGETADAVEGTDDVVEDVLWDVPEKAVQGEFYAWLAGEAGVVTGLRRHLVREHGVDRRSVAFMGYWKIGRAEN